MTQSAHLAYAAFDILSKKQWAYFQDFALPLINRASKDRLSSNAYVSLLADLSVRGQLPPLDTVFVEVGHKFADQIASWAIVYKNGKVTQRQVSQMLLEARLYEISTDIPLYRVKI